MLEEERKFAVADGFELPDLGGYAPRGGRLLTPEVARLHATYYDTADLRLARAGASLRFRDGDDEPWTVKLPTATVGVRNEISAPGHPKAIPRNLIELVTALSRGARLTPVITLVTQRAAYRLCDKKGQVLLEVADDAVTVLAGESVVDQFREIEVERAAAKSGLFDRVSTAVFGAGGQRGEFVPKHVRALSAVAQLGPGDWPEPAPLPPRPPGSAVLINALRRSAARIVNSDPWVRLGTAPTPSDTAVHQMRVGCRRLRSDLRTYAPLVRRGWAKRLRSELGWLADGLGAARDAEVLRDRLRQTSLSDPLTPMDASCLNLIDAELATRQAQALRDLRKMMTSTRYLRLIETLQRAVTEPALTALAAKPARKQLTSLADAAWERLAVGGPAEVGADRLTADAPDAAWHAVRINGKRARYALDAIATVSGPGTKRLLRDLMRVQELLGEQQDAVVAAHTWLSVAQSSADDHALAVTAGRLVEREYAAARAARSKFPAAWSAATHSRLRLSAN